MQGIHIPYELNRPMSICPYKSDLLHEKVTSKKASEGSPTLW